VRPNLDDLLTISLFREHEVKKHIQPKQGDIFIDIGAHAGAYCIRAAKIIGERGKVIALEPHPENFKLLLSNIAYNKLNNVIALPVAASDADGISHLYVTAHGTGSHTLVKHEKNKYVSELIVRTVTLDSIIERFKLSRLDWIKIDVEGAELKVLRGGEKALKIARKLIIEVWNENSDYIFNLLKSYGYKIYPIQRNPENIYILARKDGN